MKAGSKGCMHGREILVERVLLLQNVPIQRVEGLPNVDWYPEGSIVHLSRCLVKKMVLAIR